MSITTTFIQQQDMRLGRHLVHDSASKEHRAELPRSAAPLRTVRHRKYDPYPEPAQRVGCCTGVAECMMGNASDNRVMGEVLDMDDALRIYALATSLDPFRGTYPPNDTGSSGLAAAKAAKLLGISDSYVWYFGINEVLRGLQENPISIGGLWSWDMFKATKENPVVTFTGGEAGGHQWDAFGYDAKREIVWGECWWGRGFGYNGRFGISVKDLEAILEEGGDAHFSYRKMPTT